MNETSYLRDAGVALQMRMLDVLNSTPALPSIARLGLAKMSRFGERV